MNDLLPNHAYDNTWQYVIHVFLPNLTCYHSTPNISTQSSSLPVKSCLSSFTDILLFITLLLDSHLSYNNTWYIYLTLRYHNDELHIYTLPYHTIIHDTILLYIIILYYNNELCIYYLNYSYNNARCIYLTLHYYALL